MAEVVDRLRLPCPYCQQSSTVLRCLMNDDDGCVLLECPSCDQLISVDKSLLSDVQSSPSTDPQPSADQQQRINELLSQQPCPYCPYEQHSLLTYDDITGRWECVKCQRTIADDVTIEPELADVMHEELKVDVDNTLRETSVNVAGPEYEAPSPTQEEPDSNFDLSQLLETAGNSRHEKPCPVCSSTSPDHVTTVYDSAGDEIVRYCSVCDLAFGIDDTMNVFEFPELIRGGDQLMLEPCQVCGNEAVDEFELVYKDATEGASGDANEVALRCKKCQHCVDIPDVSAPGDTGAADAGEEDDDNDDDNDNGDGDRIATCQCGETDATQNILCYDGTGTITHVVCQTCDRVTTLVSWTPNEDVPTRDIPVTYIDQLRPGDHVKWPRKAGLYWHHAIVTEVEAERIRVIEYLKGDSRSIELNWVALRLGRDRMTRVDYDSSYPDEVVVARAKSRLGESGYGLYNNNCEHFARWCKTGDDTSCQVNAVDKGLRGGIKVLVNGGKHLAVKVAEACCSKATFGAILNDSVGKIGLKNILGSASGFAAKALCFGVGIALNVIVDGAALLLAIRDAVNKKKQNVLSHAEFIRKVIRIGVSKGLGCLGSIAGSILGTVFIPIPILGGLIGSGLGVLLDYISYKLIPHMMTV